MALEKLIFKNGDVYEGEIKNGKPHGQGTMTYKDGTIDEGEWYEGSLIVRGLSSPDDNFKL